MTRPTTWRWLALLLLPAAFAAAACGGAAPSASTAAGGATSPPPVAIARACDLLTDADIESITGTTVVSKSDNVADTIYANHCRWTLQRPDGGNGTLDLGVFSPGGRELYDHSGGTAGLEPLEGLPADDAGLDTNTGSVFAVQGDTLVDVTTLSILSDTDKDVQLARKVLERLFGAGGPAATTSTGGQATSSTGGTVSDPCTLLTDQEILEVTGFAVLGKTGGPRGGMWNAACVWEVQGAGVVPATVTVTIKSPGGRTTWDQYMVPIQGEFTQVAGLGDAAFAKVHWPTHVVVGDTYVSVQLIDSPDPEGPVSTELARRVVEKLTG